MNLNYFLINSLPKLAWCAIINKFEKKCHIYHGSQVEIHHDFFSDGAWNESFDRNGLVKSSTLCGTAGCILDEKLWFFSSTDNVSALYSIKRQNTLFISNSPIFVLSVAELKPHPIYPFYAYDFIRIFQGGLNCHSGHLPTSSKYPLKVHFLSVLKIDNELNITESTHPLCEPPKDYESYKLILQAEFESVIRNSQDKMRKFSYALLTLISKGYDSVATSILAANAGCKNAITFIDSKKENPNEDSGKDIAELLKMSCIEYDRWEYLNNESPIEPEFAFTTRATNPSMFNCHDSLPCTILISGAFGGTAWEYEHSIKADNLLRPEVNKISAFSQLEYRLRIGYLVFAPAMIASRHNKQLSAISISSEMAAWSLDNKSYNKPIPRRIVEEHGIPRHTFGIKKMASGQAHFYKEEDLSKKALINYEDFLATQFSTVDLHKKIFYKLIAKIENFLHAKYFAHHQNKVCKKPNSIRLTALGGKRDKIPWKYSFMFQWAFDSLKSRYALPEKIHIKNM